jgi:hypothetical protein
VLLVIGQAIMGLVLWFALGGAGLESNLWARAATSAVPFLLFPLIFYGSSSDYLHVWRTSNACNLSKFVRLASARSRSEVKLTISRGAVSGGQAQGGCVGR